jgi:hypothetical protein
MVSELEAAVYYDRAVDHVSLTGAEFDESDSAASDC